MVSRKGLFATATMFKFLLLEFSPQVQVPERRVDLRAQLPPIGAGGSKPLEVDDQDFGPPLERVELGALLLRLARLARRLLVAVKSLLGYEQLQKMRLQV